MDWDKLRIFQAAADAGSFTHAGETLGLSQSAVSRQVGALEHELGAPLFHRHARGLILTEQGEMLHEAVHDVVLKLDAVRSRLVDTREKPHGDLRVTCTLALGANWLAPRLGEFVDLYPEVKLQLLLSDDEFDLGMREADMALRLREPMQPDLIRRRLFTVHFHAYASADYLKKSGQPRTIADLDHHRMVAFGAPTATHFLYDLNSLLTAGRDPNPAPAPYRGQQPRRDHPRLEHGVGIAVLPDYSVQPNSGLVRLLPQADMPEMDCFLVYAEELKNVARVQAFRDFLVVQGATLALLRARGRPRSHVERLFLQPLVEPGDLFAVAVEEQGRPVLASRQEGLAGLAPARMRHVRIDVGPEAVLVGAELSQKVAAARSTKLTLTIDLADLNPYFQGVASRMGAPCTFATGLP